MPGPIDGIGLGENATGDEENTLRICNGAELMWLEA